MESWKEHPYAARLLLRRSDPDKIDDFLNLADKILSAAGSDTVTPFAGEIYDLAVDLLAKDNRPESRQMLRKLFDENPDRRDRLASKIAERPTPEDRPYLIRSLSFGSNNTLGFALRALRRLKSSAEKPEDVRLVILAGLKLGDQGGKAAVELVQEWTKVPPGTAEIGPALATYQEWFKKTYPNEPAPELPKADAESVTFNTDQILSYIENDARGRQGDIKHGREIYAKAQCIKCHKFGAEGQGIGPDLTTLRRRFRKRKSSKRFSILRRSSLTSTEQSPSSRLTAWCRPACSPASKDKIPSSFGLTTANERKSRRRISTSRSLQRYLSCRRACSKICRCRISPTCSPTLRRASRMPNPARRPLRRLLRGAATKVSCSKMIESVPDASPSMTRMGQ